jgi:hypothetical protein
MNCETGSIQVFRGLPGVVVDVLSIMRKVGYEAGYEAGIKAASKILVRESRRHYFLYKAEKETFPPWLSDDLDISFAFAAAGTEIRKLLK